MVFKRIIGRVRQWDQEVKAAQMQWAAERVAAEQEPIRRYREEQNQAYENSVRRAQQRKAVLAPAGASVDDALDAVTSPDLAREYRLGPGGFDESFRPIAARLIRTFRAPDEQVLGADEFWVDDDGRSKKCGAVIFTHGVALRWRGREFRTETEADLTVQNFEHLTVGSEIIYVRSPYLVDALRLQQDLRARH
jgi:hypothetical protein